MNSFEQVKRWEEFPNVTFTFDCTGRSIGFYADQVMELHMELELERAQNFRASSGFGFRAQVGLGLTKVFSS